MIFAMHDPLADLLGEWSRGLNTGSVLLRISLAVLLASVSPFLLKKLLIIITE